MWIINFLSMLLLGMCIRVSLVLWNRWSVYFWFKIFYVLVIIKLEVISFLWIVIFFVVVVIFKITTVEGSMKINCV